MNDTVAQEQQDKREAERLLASAPAIPEGEGIDVELYADSTGIRRFSLSSRVTGHKCGQGFLQAISSLCGRGPNQDPAQ